MSLLESKVFSDEIRSILGKGYGYSGFQGFGRGTGKATEKKKIERNLSFDHLYLLTGPGN